MKQGFSTEQNQTHAGAPMPKREMPAAKKRTVSVYRWRPSRIVAYWSGGARNARFEDGLGARRASAWRIEGHHPTFDGVATADAMCNSTRGELARIERFDLDASVGREHYPK